MTNWPSLGRRSTPGSIGRVDPRAFLASLTEDDLVAPSLVHVRELPARHPVISPFPGWIPPLVRDRMELVGVHGLYPHQADGLEILAADRNLIMATQMTTASVVSTARILCSASPLRATFVIGSQPLP